MPSKFASRWSLSRPWGVRRAAWSSKLGSEEVREKVENLRKKGIRIYRLMGADVVYGSEGERFVNKPLSSLLVKAAEEGWDMYASSKRRTKEDLVNAIIGFEKRHWGENYDPKDIILLPGSGFAFNLLFFTMLDPGDNISSTEPSHFMNPPSSFINEFYGADIVGCRTDESKDWEPDLVAMRKSINKKTKFIALVHPNNPCGALYSDKILKEIINLAGEHDLFIFSDEIYRDIIFDGHKFSPIMRLAKDVPTILTYSFSKGVQKPGWAIGYMKFSDPEGKIQDVQTIARRIAATYDIIGTIPTPLVVAAGAAFNEEKKYLIDPCKEMVKQLQVHRDYTYKRLNEIEGVSVTKPKASLYALPHVHGIREKWKTDSDFFIQLMKEKGIVFTPGYLYGDSGVEHFRTLLMPKTEVLEEVYTRLERFLAEHKVSQ